MPTIRQELKMNLFQATRNVSALHPEENILLRLVKLQEEAGELAAPTLQLLHYKPRKGATEEELKASQKEEAVDVFLVSFDIIHKLGIEEDELYEILSRKLEKWKGYIENNQIQRHTLIEQK